MRGCNRNTRNIGKTKNGQERILTGTATITEKQPYHNDNGSNNQNTNDKNRHNRNTRRNHDYHNSAGKNTHVLVFSRAWRNGCA